MERICTKIFPCAECKKEFTSRASLHKHLKQHDLNLASYYTKYHPRLNKLTGDPLPFKRFDEYFERDFFSYDFYKENELFHYPILKTFIPFIENVILWNGGGLNDSLINQ